MDDIRRVGVLINEAERLRRKSSTVLFQSIHVIVVKTCKDVVVTTLLQLVQK